MATIELVEQLRKLAQVSYGDAKAALDACGDDILEALIYLEKQGKVKPPTQGGTYATPKQGPSIPPPPPPNPRADRESVGSVVRQFANWLLGWIRKGNVNYFVTHRHNEHVFSLPITIFVILFLVALPTSVFILLIGLFTGFRYSFQGPDLPDFTPRNSHYNDPKE